MSTRETLFRSGGYMSLPFTIARRTDLTAVAKLVWMKLANHLGPLHTKSWPSMDEMAEQLGTSRKTVLRACELLEALHLIEVERPGQGRPNVYTINQPEDTETGVKMTPVSKRPQCQNDPTNWGQNDPLTTVVITERPPTADSGLGGDREIVHPRWRKFATLLQSAVFARTHVDRAHLVGQWAKQFRLLHTRDKVPIDLIKSILSQYCAALAEDDPYLPQGYCGRTFREKFPRIVSYMKRQQEGRGPSEEQQEARAQRVRKQIAATAKPKTHKPVWEMDDEEYDRELQGT